MDAHHAQAIAEEQFAALLKSVKAGRSDALTQYLASPAEIHPELRIAA